MTTASTDSDSGTNTADPHYRSLRKAAASLRDSRLLFSLFWKRSLHIGKCSFTLFDDECLFCKIHLAVRRCFPADAPDTVGITVNKAVIDPVHLRHYVLLKKREIVIFLLDDSLFFFLDMRRIPL